MTRVRLIKGRSYQGHGITVTRANPFAEASDAIAAVLINGGFFIAANPDETPPPVHERPANRAITSYDLMTMTQLKEAAAKEGISAKGMSKAKLIEALACATEKKLPETEGSLTMIALQEKE